MIVLSLHNYCMLFFCISPTSAISRLSIKYTRFAGHTVRSDISFSNFSSKMTAISPSTDVRGMTILNREKFNKSVNVPVLKLSESHVSSAMKFIKKYLLKLDNFKPVQNVEDITDSVHLNEQIFTANSLLSGEPTSTKYAFLNPSTINDWIDIDLHDRENLMNLGILEKCFHLRELVITYENWKADDILKAVLPVDKDNLTSFSKIGHIVHVNLKDHLLDYKNLIGQVLLDKVKNCRTVVYKTNSIDNTYRNFSMEVLCGEQDFQALVKENKCSFEFDFSKVYWNPRLCTEHERIVKMLKTGDTLFDVFAGVGPFSIPALRKKCKVYANDLNPESFKWLTHNAKLNKVSGSNFKAYNLDGRLFIKEIFATYLIKKFVNSDVLDLASDIHVTMNLPAMAVDFVNEFYGLLNGQIYKNPIHFREPIVHVYCFVIGDNPIETAKAMVEKNLGCVLSEKLIDIFNVRNVSPKKEMMRVSFHLSLNILLGDKTDVLDQKKDNISEEGYQPQAKLKKI